MKKKKILLLVLVIAALSIIAGFILCKIFVKSNNDGESISFDSTIVSTITMDINPSIEIYLNKDNVVIDVKSLNEDGNAIIEGKTFAQKNIEEAMQLLINSIKENNYLGNDKNILLLNVVSDNKDLTELVDDKINLILNENKITADVIIQQVVETDELKELARKNNMTVSKAYYISEQIKNDSSLKVEDFKDVSLNEVESKIKTIQEKGTKQEEQNATKQSSGEQRKGSLSKCERVQENITIEQAINIAVSDRGGKYNPGGYCDIRSVDAYGSLSPEGVCSIMVSYNYKQKNCTYYINVETGDIVGNPICKNVPTSINDSQCIIMADIGVSAREQISIKTEKQGSTEIVSTVEDNHGDLYEYHISKSNGSIISKTLIKKAEPVYAGSEE